MWTIGLEERVLDYLISLRDPHFKGRFHPCLQGQTPTGRSASLGFTCFATKILYTLNQWQFHDDSQRQELISVISGYQIPHTKPICGPLIHPFLDLIIYEDLLKKLSFRDKISLLIRNKQTEHPLSKLNAAETKQALATLAQVGASAPYQLNGYPTNVHEVSNYLNSFDWTKPWGAGGQTSALIVFLKLASLQQEKFLEYNKLFDIAKRFFSNLSDPITGGYFRGEQPEHGELINGAMKVLTALDWLEEPIHYPERLIDSCLAFVPIAEGCHLVDTVYVLYRSSLQTEYRRKDIDIFYDEILKMIRLHHNQDGGFSYYVGRAQTHYYGANISYGYPESDIHGTCLLSWALAMITQTKPRLGLTWKVMRP